MILRMSVSGMGGLSAELPLFHYAHHSVHHISLVSRSISGKSDASVELSGEYISSTCARVYWCEVMKMRASNYQLLSHVHGLSGYFMAVGRLSWSTPAESSPKGGRTFDCRDDVFLFPDRKPVRRI